MFFACFVISLYVLIIITSLKHKMSYIIYNYGFDYSRIEINIQDVTENTFL